MKLSFSVPMMARFRTLVGKSTSEQQGARMHFRVKKCVSVLATAALLFAPEIPARPQDKPHVVSLIDLNLDAARVAQTRQANEEAARTLLSFEEAQKALKSVHLDYQKVDKAVGQLSDEDLAKLAQRSRQTQADFAAGRLSNGAIVAIVAVIAAVIIIAVIASQLNHS